jgi:hypothetical protein
MMRRNVEAILELEHESRYQEHMKGRAEDILRLLADAWLLVVEPGGQVFERTSHGIHGDADDLAFSISWRDGQGCVWAADFSEQALASSTFDSGAVVLRDMEGAVVALRAAVPLELPPGNLSHSVATSKAP